MFLFPVFYQSLCELCETWSVLWPVLPASLQQCKPVISMISLSNMSLKPSCQVEIPAVISAEPTCLGSRHPKYSGCCLPTLFHPPGRDKNNCWPYVHICQMANYFPKWSAAMANHNTWTDDYATIPLNAL